MAGTSPPPEESLSLASNTVQHQAEAEDGQAQAGHSEEDRLHRSGSKGAGRGSGGQDRVVDQPGRPDPDGQQGDRRTALAERREWRERLGVGDLGVVDLRQPFGF